MIFEIANTYKKNKKGHLPIETRVLSLALKGEKAAFYHAKGYIEQLTKDMGIEELTYQESELGGLGADIYCEKTRLGTIQVLDENVVTLEANFETLLSLATLKKTYTPLAKYPPITEDLAFVVEPDVQTGALMKEIKKQSKLITQVTLLDMYENSKTFHIVYQDKEKNLTTEEVAQVRENIIKAVKEKFNASPK
ncbi:MAG TPA: hypothetical protein VFQ63_00190, partial [Patescibacteria group bacterium]|nr:hypothetical protein [Patescibacteria group bacterium]